MNVIDKHKIFFLAFILISFSLTGFSQATASARVGATIISTNDLVVDSLGNIVLDDSGYAILKDDSNYIPIIEKSAVIEVDEVVHLYAVSIDEVKISERKLKRLKKKYNRKKN